MPEYHVAASGVTGDIYAGQIDPQVHRWITRSTVTDEAVTAAADHVMMQYEGEMVARFGAPDGTRMRVEIIVSPDTPEETSHE